MLTVANLRAALATFPDNTPVGILDEEGWCTEVHIAQDASTDAGTFFCLLLERKAETHEQTCEE